MANSGIIFLVVIIMIIITIVTIVYSMQGVNEAKKQLTADEQRMYDAGHKLGYSDEKIQAEIDRIEGK